MPANSRWDLIRRLRVKCKKAAIRAAILLVECATSERERKNKERKGSLYDFKKAYDSVRRNDLWIGGRTCTIFSLSLVSPRNW